MTVQAGSKSELAYAAVKGRIVGGELGPGQRLVLSSLAEELGCSVVPVREAIRRLEAEGLVTFERNVGAAVAGIDPVEYTYTMETLALVEGAATALAAPQLTKADVIKARRINAAMRAELTDFSPATFTALNRDFHTVLFERCPNPHILDLVHRGWDRLAALRSSTFAFIPGRAAASVAEHEALLALLESGAGLDAVERAARAHRCATLGAYLARSGGHSPDIEYHQGAHGEPRQQKGGRP